MTVALGISRRARTEQPFQPLATRRARNGRRQSRQERAVDHEETGHRSVTVVRRYIRDA